MDLDFMTVGRKTRKNGVMEIYPKFIVNNRSKDLMIRGGDFYGIWIEEQGLWSTDEQDAITLIDDILDKYVASHHFDVPYQVLHMWDGESGMIDVWHRYCQHQLRDNFKPLDENMFWSNDVTTKADYASKKLPYPLQAGDISAYDKLIGTLYSEPERHKIEWAIGSIVSGDSKYIQKFLVLYGSAGTGKSTILNIIQKLFDGYCSTFDAKALGSSNNAFALEAFKSNPLVAIQHDGDLSRIEDNTRLNSLVSHELMTVNEKFKPTYPSRFRCFLFMGTNRPVRITDAKSGLIRRLIDVSPTGDKVPTREYHDLVKEIDFELGAIAEHCKQVYEANPGYYDSYVPISMLGASNDFYNFVAESYFTFKNEENTSLKSAWALYKAYCDDARVPYPLTQRVFKEELRNYFAEFKDRYTLEDGTRIRNYYIGFLTDKFEEDEPKSTDIPAEEPNWIVLKHQKSIFDTEFSSCPAQYANVSETPIEKWDSVETTLADISTNNVHYVKTPENLIVIDFDITDEKGDKSLELNLQAARSWPETYAETSKSGNGLHLHYYYDGDVSELNRIYDEHIEIKVFTGKSSLRRKLTVCNDIPIATLSSGLPKRSKKKMVNWEGFKSEKALRSAIKSNLEKQICSGTKPSIDLIKKDLDEAYENRSFHYDVSDLKNTIIAFAAHSTHHAQYCLGVVKQMKFKSDEGSNNTEDFKDDSLYFFDIEIFPNLFILCWKKKGKQYPVIREINPSPEKIEKIVQYKLIGHNCRRYDNHICYARMMGYTIPELYNLSQKIINKEKDCFFGEAYNISYTDTYDFASAGNKKSLKKLEIEMGIHHQELGLPWDQPVPEELWETVAEYCDNDVLATEAAFDYLSADWEAREILADISDMTVNDTTNSMSRKFVFQGNSHPQSQFNYRNMGDTSIHTQGWVVDKNGVMYPEVDEFTLFDDKDRPVFPGYEYKFGKSTYRGEEVGEGGYVYAEPGIYTQVALLDIASMHPSSIIAEELFGPVYTKRFKEIVDARVAIKHRDFETARKMFGGALTKYLDEEHADALANALKTIINSVYGLTAARFENAFKDPRNVDNIVAKRGALFMVNLKHAVQERGFTVAHIKTDSIKIPNATEDIIQFVMDYGKRYGYNFEHEATYDRMCLVNDAVYIAKYDDKGVRNKGGKHASEWTATGTQFQVPYVFKKLFTKDDIQFEDLCETKSVSSALYLDMNEDLPDVSDLEAELEKIRKQWPDINNAPESREYKDLKEAIAKGHSYHFVGRVGQFCPVVDGAGGGLLMRETKNKYGEVAYAAATGTKGYRWMESEMVKFKNIEDKIDRGYYDNLANAAVDVISQYGDFEWFVSEEPKVSPYFAPDNDEPPF